MQLIGKNHTAANAFSHFPWVVHDQLANFAEVYCLQQTVLPRLGSLGSLGRSSSLGALSDRDADLRIPPRSAKTQRKVGMPPKLPYFPRLGRRTRPLLSAPSSCPSTESSLSPSGMALCLSVGGGHA